MSEKPFFFFTLNMRCWVDVETVVVAEDVSYCRKTNNSQGPLPIRSCYLFCDHTRLSARKLVCHAI